MSTTIIAPTPTNLNPIADDLLSDPTLVDPDAPVGEPVLNFSDEVKRNLVYHLLHDLDLARWALGKITGKVFGSKAHKLIVDIAQDYLSQYGDLIPHHILVDEVRRQTEDDKSQAFCVGEAIVQTEFVLPLGRPQWYKDALAKFHERFLVSHAMHKGIEKADQSGDFREFYELVDEARKATGSHKALELYTVDEIQARPSLVWQIQDHFPKNGTVTVFGPSGVGKSFVCLEMGLSVAHGVKYLDKWQTVQGNVLYLCSEGAYGLKGRTAAWYSHRGLTPNKSMVFSVTSHNLQDRPEVERLLDHARRKLPGGTIDLVVVDTLSRNFGAGDTDKNADMQKYLANVDHIREATGATVCNVHHTGWGDVNRERGAKSLRDYSDSTIGLVKEAELIEVSCKKQKDAAEFTTYILRPVLVSVADSLALKIEGTKSAIKKAGKNKTALEREQAILDTLPVTSDYAVGLTQTDIVEATGLTVSMVQRCLDKLRADFSAQRGRGGNARDPWLYYRESLLPDSISRSAR